MDLGPPIAYMVLEEGTPVFTRDGAAAGSVKRVLADAGVDVFDGLILDTPDGDRFVDADYAGDLYERGVVLALDRADLRHLPEPSPSPAALGVSPDDVAPDTPGDQVRDTLRRAWDRISGRY